ncbi:MAG: iron ABC transporter permease [Firmicutes bacterium]|nr:iron ABC transporter permease [Bacillota bacterium]
MTDRYYNFTEENRRRWLRYAVVFIALTVAVLVITVLNINIGSVPISVPDIARIIFKKEGVETEVNIIWRIRLPRIIIAALLGGALSLSGFLLQTFFANPIAGPFVLGISSGAKLVVALTMIYLLQVFSAVPSTVLVIAAFVGSLIATGFILLISRRIRNMSALLVAGIMIGYICSAVTDFIVTFAEDSDIVNLRGWSLGSFSGMSWENVQTAALITVPVVLLTFMLSKPIGAYQLGEHYAQSMGVNIRRFRVTLIMLSSILSACVTAFAGPISFVGIAVPHLVKRGLNTSKPLIVIPACFLGGAVFCMGCDLIARTVFAPTELNISTVTSIFGAPIVIMMMLKRQKGR